MKLTKIAAVFNAEQREKQEKIALIEKSIYEDIPGIIAWGDSLTAGAGGYGTTYPNVLQELIKSNVYPIPVINMGVGGESTNTIMGRAGAVPYVVDTFTIPEDTSKVEIKLKSLNGYDVAPLLQGDIGINPVTIKDIIGKLSVEPGSTPNQFSYYFNRVKPGPSLLVEGGTTISTETAISPDYENYIPIVLMGHNGVFNGVEELITQINTLLNMDKWNDKYLVLGYTIGPIDKEAIDSAMVTAFGERYLNLREYIIKNGLEQQGLSATLEDIEAIEQGSIPPSLLSDEIHFNSYGYSVVGQAIYERMMELGYFDTILELVSEKKSL